MNAAAPATPVGTNHGENVSNFLNLPPKSRSPNRLASRRFSAIIDITSGSLASHEKRLSTAGALVQQPSAETELLSQKKPSPRLVLRYMYIF